MPSHALKTHLIDECKKPSQRQQRHNEQTFNIRQLTLQVPKSEVTPSLYEGGCLLLHGSNHERRPSMGSLRSWFTDTRWKVL